MGLLQKACETYDNLSHLVGVYQEGQVPLAPVAHQLTNADIEVSIDINGNFLQAVAFDSETTVKIIIPVTEDSAGRTSTGASKNPHPLCDKIKHITSEKYISQLKEWCSSQYTHWKIEAILRYLEKDTILKDLHTAGLMEKKDADEQMICWRVMGKAGEDSACWTDKRLFDLYSAYYISKKTDQAFCMISGNIEPMVANNPKGIVATVEGNAKLISANDDNGFTYRGRFTEKWQAETIGYETSQKAYNMIRWLTSNQGCTEYYGEKSKRAFLCWNPKGKKVPSPARVFFAAKEEETLPTPSDYSAALRRTLSGWQDELPEGEDIVIASFDAATPGRLSVTYYNELKSSDFLQRLHDWDESCAWYNGKFGVQSPSLRQIIDCAYGTERDTKLTTDDALEKAQMQRLLSCRIDRKPIPFDLVHMLVNRASMPQAYDKSNRERILFTACAVIRKYRRERYKEECAMALEPNKPDRSYQFGRLLAILEKVERDTYGADESRETNAIKKQSIFVQRPLSIAKTIEEQLEKAYFPKLRAGSRIYYKNLIGEIMNILSEMPETEINKPLGETYLMGYYLQRKEFYTKRTTESINEEEE